MLGSCAFFVVVAGLLKEATLEVTSMQAVLYRSLFAGLAIGLTMVHRGEPVRSTHWRLLMVRGGIGFAAISCYLWAVAHAPLADVMALQQMSPIFVAFLSILLLRERPRPLHFGMAALCLIGALLVVQPTRGFASLNSAAALGSAILSSGAFVATRALTRTEPTRRIVFWFCAIALLLSLPFVMPGWQWPSWRSNLLLITAGLLGAGAQGLMTAAYRRAEAHVTSAFSYANVPLAYLAGLIFWDEQPNAWAGLGILLIAVGGVVIVISVRPKNSA